MKERNPYEELFFVKPMEREISFQLPDLVIFDISYRRVLFGFVEMNKH